MNRDKVKEIRELLNKELELFGKKHDLTVDVGNARFSDSDVRFSVRFIDGSLNVDNAMQLDYNKYCLSYGLGFDDFGKEFTVGGERYKIIGIKPRNRKYPIIAKRVHDGKHFKFSVFQVSLAKTI